jgi:hypothetical protein
MEARQATVNRVNEDGIPGPIDALYKEGVTGWRSRLAALGLGGSDVGVYAIGLQTGLHAGCISDFNPLPPKKQ